MSAPLLVACAATVVVLGLPVLAGAGALDVQRRVAGAADSAALAAADAAGGWIAAEPCDIAAEVAAAVATKVARCEVDLITGITEVAVSAGSVFGEITVAARAGPPA